MGIIVDLGKLKVQEILVNAYEFAKEETDKFHFGQDNQDDYSRGIKITCLTKRDKLDWAILDLLANEIDWFFANRQFLSLGFRVLNDDHRHDVPIFFESRIAMKLNEHGIACYSDILYRY